MIAFPPCKINLGLNIVSKRQDGFHNIETCFYPVPWTDILEIIPSTTLAMTFSGNAIPGNATENLCLRAYEILKRDFALHPVKIHLHKIIPIGAGLGGGSADAAFTLRLLNEIFGLSLSLEQLQKYAAQLGSDCAFFTQGNPKFGSGKGDVLDEISLSLKGYWLVVVNPPIHISTQQAYSGVIPQLPKISLREILCKPVEEWTELLKNDFETTTFNLFPEILEIKKKLYAHGAIYASMSGSGSAVFGLFKTSVQLRNLFPNMNYWEGELT